MAESSAVGVEERCPGRREGKRARYEEASELRARVCVRALPTPASAYVYHPFRSVSRAHALSPFRVCTRQDKRLSFQCLSQSKKQVTCKRCTATWRRKGRLLRSLARKGSHSKALLSSTIAKRYGVYRVEGNGT